MTPETQHPSAAAPLPDDLRAEFRHVDLRFVRRHCPHALKLAQRYNAKRALVDPADPTTHDPARRALAKLLAAVAS